MKETKESQTNYVDAMTPEEREAQSKIEVTTTYSKSTGEVLTVEANGVQVFSRPAPTAQEGWRERFDRQFDCSMDGAVFCREHRNPVTAQEIKSFIDQELRTQREELKQKLAGMKRGKNPNNVHNPHRARINGFNEALDQAIKAIAESAET